MAVPISVEETSLPVPCKVNLFLKVGQRQPDGYHDLETFFLPLTEPADTFSIRRFDETGDIDFTCSDPALETDDNLAVRAYRIYAATTGYAPRLEVKLTKRIPYGAGLGGGSADAAVMLRYLNGRAGTLALPPDHLSALALGLGSDVPFFLLARPALASGRGERLVEEDPGLSGMFLVLVCPDVHVPTGWAYAALDTARSFPGKDAANPLTSVFTGNRRAFCVTGRPLQNDFESVVFAAHPEIGWVKERLLALGAAGALLSGSGSAVFGCFRERQAAILALAECSGNGPRTFITIV